MKDLPALKEMANQNGVTLIPAELETGLAFAQIAKRSAHEKRDRNRKNARKAYDAVLRFRERVHCSSRDADVMNEKLERLRTDLAELGEDI